MGDYKNYNPVTQSCTKQAWFQLPQYSVGSPLPSEKTPTVVIPDLNSDGERSFADLKLLERYGFDFKILRYVQDIGVGLGEPSRNVRYGDLSSFHFDSRVDQKEESSKIMQLLGESASIGQIVGVFLFAIGDSSELIIGFDKRKNATESENSSYDDFSLGPISLSLSQLDEILLRGNLDYERNFKFIGADHESQGQFLYTPRNNEKFLSALIRLIQDEVTCSFSAKKKKELVKQLEEMLVSVQDEKLSDQNDDILIFYMISGTFSMIATSLFIVGSIMKWWSDRKPPSETPTTVVEGDGDKGKKKEGSRREVKKFAAAATGAATLGVVYQAVVSGKAVSGLGASLLAQRATAKTVMVLPKPLIRKLQQEKENPLLKTQ